MSSSGEDFGNMDSGSESEGYTPVKKAPAVKKAAATKPKAAPKAKATTATKAKPAASKKKVLVDHNDNAEDSFMAVDEDDDAPRYDDDEPAAGPSKKKTASEKYQKLTQIEHILKRPDSYIGSVERISQVMWTYDAEEKRMVNREVSYVPGFFKIIDEILVNAADNKTNDPSMDMLKVNIDIEENTISVYNNGRGIPIEIHSKENCYIPELIFGHLLSGSNYDDDEKKLTGGRNGFGAKLANIYSHEFTIETADKSTGQKYKQTWTGNMGTCGKPKITKNGKGEEWTRVTFRPDLKRFGMETIDEDTAGLLRKRVYDMAGVVKDIKVFLNDERLKVKNFKSYVEMYLDSAATDAMKNSDGAAQTKPATIYERIGNRWEVAFTVSDGSFQHVSFANAISTTKGGTHVNLLADQISKNLIACIGKKNKAATVKAAQIKNHMWIFVNALIENPTFDSQTKEQLTLTASKFGTKPVLSEDFMKKVQKSPIVDNILNWAKYKADQQIKKTDGTKRNRLTGMPKLSDANNAGTKHAKDCTLILTEGDSAKSLAVAGLGVVGRNNFGVFPLRGKLLNVREASHDQIMKNAEIQSIKKIMGLVHNKTYSDISSLRYGRLMIMTDQDHDGSHIKGLLINFFDHFYPSLLKIPDFLVEFVTPIVRVTKGQQKKDFFTIPEYEQWLEDTPGSHLWNAKYYKGLGTSTDADARNYFSHMEKHMIPFSATQEGDRDLIELAFSKKKADERKEWLRQFKPGTYLDHNLEEIPYSEFINKELILFSMADNIRSIPSVADGLKPGQRKVIWGCFKRKLNKQIKVAQLVGYIGEHAAYHHGEVSLTQTIVNLAQDYVGSNNLNLLHPAGQYGTRDAGGSDHASARYIFTEPMAISRTIFNVNDDHLLTPQKDDNTLVEPTWYLPVVPMVLVNGAEGIGTGWSTNVPSYNPVDIVANLRRLMNGEELVTMHPWWRGFKGEVKLTAKHKYDVTGIVNKIDATTVEITELPIHMWTRKFKESLETMMGGEKSEGAVKNYQEHHANHDVHFVIQMSASEVEKAEKMGLVDYFKLRTKLTTSNMICFDFEGKIKKYDSPEEILEDFYPMRLAYYQKRKDYMAGEIQLALDRLTNQARFVKMIVDKELVVSNRKKAAIVQDLKKHKFKPFPKIKKAKDAGEDADALEDEDAEAAGSDTDYDYLLGMPIYNLTEEKIEKLRKQGEDKEAELMAVLAASPQQMWNKDLDKFLEEWQQTLDNFYTNVSKSKTNKKKQGVLRTRKSIGTRKSKDSDDEDDFRPIKAPQVKKKVPESKPAPKSKPPKDEDEDISVPVVAPKRKAATKAKPVVLESDEDDDDFYDKLPVAKKKSSDVMEIDSGSEVEVMPQGKGKGRAAPKRKSMDSDEDEVKPAKKPARSQDSDSDAKSKGKGKAKAAPKRKSIDAADEDEDDNQEQPAAKKGKTAQAEVTDFFGKADAATKKAPAPRKVSKSMKPASPPKPKQKQVVIDDSDDEIDYDALPKPPARTARARAPPKKSAYVDVSEDDEDDGGDESFMDE
ncbi:DNA topoisomerase II [Mycena floridula]|nr:DNA topoisomerase II [Mycena floridula]